MGHFVIDLPENKKADVRWGKVFKMQFSIFHKNKSQSKRAYIVQVSDSIDKVNYQLFKSENGEWFKDAEGASALDTKILFDIKDAILHSEIKKDRKVE